jgi:DNA-binding transcriptional MerR regulator
LPGEGGVYWFRWKVDSGPLTLVDLARAARMSIDHVRFYRESGLLQPPRRQRGRSDRFAFQAEHIERLRFIKRALQYGFLVEHISKMLEDATTCSDVHRIALHRLADLRRIGGPEATIAVLENLIALCVGVGSRKDCKILDALANGPKPNPK